MSARFVAVEGKLKGLVLPLEDSGKGEAEEWVIGRDPDQCQLVVEDPKVSRRHLLCRREKEGFVLENLSATNPVEVNGKIVKDTALLAAGDRVRIGAEMFTFSLGEEETRVAIPEGEMPQVVAEFYEPTHIGAPDLHFDLTIAARWLLKVIAGPNLGAEFSLEGGRSYTLGTDSTACDIVFNDLSVSRQHAKLTLTADEERLTVEDLGSRNGIAIEDKTLEGSVDLAPNQIVTLGTTAFVVIDREGAQDTIIAPLLGAVPKASSAAKASKHEGEAAGQDVGMPGQQEAIKEPAPQEVSHVLWARSGWVFIALLTCFLLVMGSFVATLFHETQAPEPPAPQIEKSLDEALKDFPDVKYSYNPFTRKLFLLGHVSSYLQKQQLTYNLQGIPSLGLVDDHVIVDEVIWQEMNILLEKNPNWVGISMHAPSPGVFVISGYLQTRKQAQLLTDYLNLNFPYQDLLKNQVIVEEDVASQIGVTLSDAGFSSVLFALNNGELTLTGTVPNTAEESFRQLLEKIKKVPGVRVVKNFVKFPPPEDSVIDISSRYAVSGYSQQDKVNVNVLINGKILMEGDTLDGMKIISISAGSIFLEKDSVKYRIQYKG